MKRIITFILLLFVIDNSTTAQQVAGRFGLSNSSQKNVNNPSYVSASRRDIINATVKLAFVKNGNVKSWCTGTLINRNTTDNNIGFYVLTARHCFFENDGMGNMDFDSNAEHYVIFNYQSFKAENDSTAKSNKGDYYKQSIHNNDNGYEYFHKTQLRLVDYFFWGDFALVEILTAVPPHFNIAYVGWYPSKFGTHLYTQTTPAPIVNIHHPRGDIKKISGTNNVVWLETPLATGCYTITKVIDFLFGWIWKRKISTSVICNYIDNP